MTWPDCWNDSERSVGASTLPVEVTLDSTTPRLAVASVCVVDAELERRVHREVRPDRGRDHDEREKPVQEQPFAHVTSPVLLR